MFTHRTRVPSKEGQAYVADDFKAATDNKKGQDPVTSLPKAAEVSARTVFYFIVWFFLNALFNVYNKRVLDAVGLPWVMTVVQLSTGFVLVLPLWVCRIRSRPTLARNDWRWLVPLGFFHALSSAGGVYAINSGAVSTFQVLKAMEPIITAVLAAALYSQYFAWQVYFTIVPVVYGVLHAFWDGGFDLKPAMFFGTFVSIVGASMRSVNSKQKMKDISPANLFALMNATSLVLLLPLTVLDLASLAEAQERLSHSEHSSATLFAWAIMSGFFFYSNNEVAFYALQKVHPVSHAVANIIRRVLIILSSVLLLGDTLSPKRATGAAIAITGVFAYSTAKHKFGTRKQPPNVPRKAVLGLGLAAAVVYLASSWPSYHTYYPAHAMLQASFVKKSSTTPDMRGPQPQGGSQPLVHFLRVNDVSLTEIMHVFQRADGLDSPSAANATGKVMCFVGLRQESAVKLSSAWVRSLGGEIGRIVPDRTATANQLQLSGCDVVVSAGGTYRSVSNWAFHSPIPVINLWNTDDYYPQAALLLAYQLAQKAALHGYPTDLLSKSRVYLSAKKKKKIRVYMGNWAGPSELWAIAEAAYLMQFQLDKCPKSTSCKPWKRPRAAPILADPAPALLAALSEMALAKTGKLPQSYPFPGIRCDEAAITVSGKINGHDGHYAYGRGGSVLFVVEWERVTKVKYAYDRSRTIGAAQAADIAAGYASSEHNVSNIGLFVVVRSAETHLAQTSEIGGETPLSQGEKSISRLFPGVPVIFIEQLRAHAAHAFLDSPFETALVLAVHGGGSEPWACALYLARRGMHPVVLKVCDQRFTSIGHRYQEAATSFVEVVGQKARSSDITFSQLLSAPGTFMGYSALGRPLACLREVEEKLLHGLPAPRSWDPLLLMERMCGPRNASTEHQRDLAYTFQELFARSMLHLVNDAAEELAGVDGLVVAGGAGLNVKVTQRLRERFSVPVWVPSAPSDPGLGIGGIWSVCHPLRQSERQQLQYHGLPLLDKQDLPQRALAWGSACTRLGMGAAAARRLAELLAVEGKIIAVVIGSQEVGPRALGHRSLMAYPDSLEIRDRMNGLKFRQFYRPTCPTLVEEFVEEMFERPEQVHSPFMSFAPKLKPWVREELPAVRHYDGSARPQTLSKSQEPFVHSMLLSIPEVRKGGKPVVINTSFNIKGQPIINSILDTLFMLCDRPQLDYVFIKGYLFTLNSQTHGHCKKVRSELRTPSPTVVPTRTPSSTVVPTMGARPQRGRRGRRGKG